MAAMGHVRRDHNAVARMRDTSLVADREGQFAADDGRDLLLRWWCMSATALASKVTKFVITESVVIGWKAMPGTRWSAGRWLKCAQRPTSSEASPDRSKQAMLKRKRT